MSPTYDKRQLLKSAYNYVQAGSYDRALEEYRRITKLFPEDPNVHSMVADLLAKKSDLQGAAYEHLEAAKLHREQGADDKELTSVRKALRSQSGNAVAMEMLESYYVRNIAKATQLIASNDLTGAEELLQKLLDGDPGHLQVNRLLDEIKAKRLQAEAMKELAEEERQAAAEAPVPDSAKEVMDRLGRTADAYLKAEDFDNAIDTLLIMLKIEPTRQDIRGRLEQAQEQLKKKQQAQAVWQNILAKDQDKVLEVKERELSAKEIAEWANQEQAVRERVARELEGLEAQARQELQVIERAVQEIRLKSDGRSVSSASPEGAQLQALEQDKKALEEKLMREREVTVERERQIQDQVRREGELLRHVIELEKLEVEAKQKDVALRELEERLRKEREEQNRKLDEERERSRTAEEKLRQQLQDLMREEMAKLRDEMKFQAKADIEQKLSQTQQRLQSVEEATRKGDEIASERLRQEQEKADEFRRGVEEKVRKEREAIQGLRSTEEARKQAIVEEALKRRNLRTGNSSEEKQKIIQASRRISDALHAASTKHLESDVEGMLETAKRYMQQDLLLDAMRICQKVSSLDPQNEKVKELLKEIYVRKGL